MLEQDDHFKHLYDNPTYIRPEDWRAHRFPVDWLIEKHKSGYQMVNSVQRLQEIKTFVRMGAGLDLRTNGWNGTAPAARTPEKPRPRLCRASYKSPDGDLPFADWNCRAGHNNVIMRTDGTVAPCFPHVWLDFRLGQHRPTEI